MPEKNCAVFSCLGLGDGLLALVLSNNLKRNGKNVVTFHPSLSGLESWFPTLPIRPFPTKNELSETLASFDQFYFFYEKTEWMQHILAYCETHFPKKMHVLNPIATTNRNYPYWAEGKFDGNFSLVDNLYAYCKNGLCLKNPTKHNGIKFPYWVAPGKNRLRVVIHPTSSRPGKNWPKEKYLELAEKLKNQGNEPIFILSNEEKKEWPEVDAPAFSSLSDLAAFVAESGAMIGNDSGIGHLASCLGLPTVTIARNINSARFWRPGWSKNALIAPASWIPNLKALRLRDKYWKHWITVNRVLKAFRLI